MAKNNSKIVLGNGKVLIDLTGDTVTANKLQKGITAHDKSGELITGTSTLDSDTSKDTAAADEILIGKTAHARGAELTGTMPNNGAVSGEITTVNEGYIVPQGYHDGSGKVGISAKDKAKIIPSNIRQGVTVLGVEGAMTGSEGIKAEAKTVTPSFEEQTVTPDAGYTHLSQVTVNAIPISFTDNSAGGQTVTIG